MTPSNDPNGKPFIYRIADALGSTHLVVAVQHSHLMSEITGLLDALAAKANAADVTTALATKANSIDAGSPGGAIVIVSDTGELSRSNQNLDMLLGSLSEKATFLYVNMELEKKQDTLTFDSTPTTGSTNPVTSGGVAAALEGKAPLSDTAVGSFIKADATDKIDLDVEFSTAHNSGTFVLRNDMPDECKIEDFFASEHGNIMSDGMIVKSDSFAVVTIYRHNDGSTTWFFISTQGLYDI